VSPSGIAGNMDQISYIESRIYSSDYWAPTERINANIGAQFTHSVSNNTFYEVKVSNFFSSNSTNPGASRDTTTAVTIGGVDFNEAPVGFYDLPASGVGSGMRMGVGMSTSRDSSKTSELTVSAAVTSQVNRVNQVKAGIEFIRTHSQINYGSFDSYLPSGRTKSKWDTKPYRVSAFAQDKLEFNGMIANLGLRLTYSNPNVDWYDYDTYSSLFAKEMAAALDTFATSPVDPQLVLQPRLGVSFPITDNSKLFFNYGHFVQVPDPENLYLVRIEPYSNTITRIAAPGNKLPKTVSYELGFEQNLLDTYLIRVSGYYKDLSDQPVQVTFTSRDNSDYSVSRPYWYEDIRGLELTLRKQRGRYFWGEINYTYDVKSQGYFGTLENYENPVDQRNYERSTRDNDITRPVPRPFARLQLYFQAPQDLGPKFLGGYPLGGWQLVPVVSWKAGSRLTYTGGGSIPGIINNLQTRDYWGTSMRLTKNFSFSNGSNIKFFADISNVLNRRNFNIYNSGLIDGNDYLAYMASLHLPKGKLKEIDLLNSRVPGSDKVGDYRPADVTYVPIETTTDLNNLVNPNERALYYNTSEGKYYQYKSGSFVAADGKYVDKVLDDKAYINMPNQRFFNFLDPRTIRVGIRFSF
jgi:hypothetical protein